MRIAIMGSGGVGGSVGARLQTAGEDVAFIARGAHLPALRRDGPVHRIAAATTALAAGACLWTTGRDRPVFLCLFPQGVAGLINSAWGRLRRLS